MTAEQKEIDNLKARLAASEAAAGEMRAALMAIFDLAAGWDEHGASGPREPLTWESVARMALDYASAGLGLEVKEKP